MKQALVRVHRACQEEEPLDGDESDTSMLARLSHKPEESLRLEDLTLEHRQRFLQSAAEGSLRDSVELWTPWWTKAPTGQLLACKILPLSDFTACPSPLVAVGLVELALSYCYVMRLYNGDAECDLCSSVAVLCRLAPSLTMAPLNSAQRAVSQFVGLVCEMESSFATALIRHCMAIAKDAVLLLGSAAHVNKALRHSQSLLEHGSKAQAGHVKRRSKLAVRKLEFLLSWISSPHFKLVDDCQQQLQLMSVRGLELIEQGPIGLAEWNDKLAIG